MKLRGFTLLELLAVIALIAVLSSISIAFIGVAQKRTRDNQRKADLNLISQAIDLYYGDTRSLPRGSQGSRCEFFSDSSSNPWIPGIRQEYVPSTAGKANLLPRDPFHGKPKGASFRYSYTCVEGEDTYTLSARLENKNDRDSENGVYTITR